ncbi:copper resistance protein NlpE N-terminal domain-containing protein [Pontibacter toksunensis]|uniref:Copper resistance protein NlpE N-terminal domain-containing protein n=1 Tax=Pontibacter toksunensis TaxID=1332631 RepID=A0ABW6BUJ0_9BACT
MKKAYTSIYIGLLLWVTAACTTEPVTNTSGISLPTEPVDVTVGGDLLPNSMPFNVVGTWHGVIPCIDCPGIVYDLNLREDNTFEETRVYQNKSTDSDIRVGTWRITDEGVLELSSQNAERTKFDLSTAGELNMLDESGNPIETPIADMYRLRRDTALTDNNTPLNSDQRRVGVDFVATGNEPGWLLEIDLEDGVYFKTRPSETVELKGSVPEPSTEGKTTKYRTQTEAGELMVELTEAPCTDSMSGRVSPYTVRVTAKGKSYSGCGMYLGSAENK